MNNATALEIKMTKPTLGEMLRKTLYNHDRALVFANKERERMMEEFIQAERVELRTFINEVIANITASILNDEIPRIEVTLPKHKKWISDCIESPDANQDIWNVLTVWTRKNGMTLTFAEGYAKKKDAFCRIISVKPVKVVMTDG
jgi:hypothetical protein